MLRVYKLQVREWYHDVWRQEAGARMCCDGHMCGCYGADYASWWLHLLGDEK